MNLDTSLPRRDGNGRFDVLPRRYVQQENLMRGMRTKLMIGALMILGLTMLNSLQAQTFLLTHITNTVWKYNQTEAFQDAAWASTAFDDSAWPSGNSAFGLEPSQPAAGFIRTPLSLGRMTYYFRTHFTAP